MQPSTAAVSTMQPPIAAVDTSFSNFLANCTMLPTKTDHIGSHPATVADNTSISAITEHSLTDHSVSHSQPIRQREFEVTGCLPARCSEWHSSVSTEQSLSNTDTVQTYTPVHARVLYTAARHYASFLATCSVPTTQTLPESVSAYCSPVYAKFLSQCTLSTDVHDRLSHITPKSHTHKRGSRGRGSRGRGSKGSSLQIDAARHAETAAVDLQQEQESFHLFLQEQDSIPRDNCLSIDSPTDQSSLHTGQGRTPDAPIEHTPQLATSQDLQQ